MKKIIGLLILIIVLAAVSGCTQPAKTTPVTTTVTTELPTATPTPVETTVVQTTVAPTASATTEVTAVATTVAANVTAPTTALTAVVTRTATPSTKITVVHIANGTFSPTPLTVLPGTRITWVNDDTGIHSVKAVGATKGKFNSMDIIPTAQWGYDFGEDEGTFEYADGYNLNVTGIIIIKKGESFVGMGTPSAYMTSNATW
jgi:plastocyanin